jgi:hypothetical protein
MQFYADVCNRCGKKVVKRGEADSSDMVKTNDSFLYLCDIKPLEAARPSLALKEYCGVNTDHTYCPDCLVAEVSEWVAKIKARGASKIHLNNIIMGDKVTSPCPVCGK